MMKLKYKTEKHERYEINSRNIARYIHWNISYLSDTGSYKDRLFSLVFWKSDRYIKNYPSGIIIAY